MPICSSRITWQTISHATEDTRVRIRSAYVNYQSAWWCTFSINKLTNKLVLHTSHEAINQSINYRHKPREFIVGTCPKTNTLNAINLRTFCDVRNVYITSEGSTVVVSVCNADIDPQSSTSGRVSAIFGVDLQFVRRLILAIQSTN